MRSMATQISAAWSAYTSGRTAWSQKPCAQVASQVAPSASGSDTAGLDTPAARTVVSIARKSAPAAIAAQTALTTAMRHGSGPSGSSVTSLPTSAASGCPGGCATPSATACATNSPESSQPSCADAVAR